MNKQVTILVAILVIVVLGVAGYFVLTGQKYGGQQTPEPTSQSQPATPATPNAVTIQNLAFTPNDLSVKVGQTVTWTNMDSFTHTITSDTGVFNSGNVANGATFSYTFTKAGTFPYHCSIHTSMTGQITVSP